MRSVLNRAIVCTGLGVAISLFLALLLAATPDIAGPKLGYGCTCGNELTSSWFITTERPGWARRVYVLKSVGRLTGRTRPLDGVPDELRSQVRRATSGGDAEALAALMPPAWARLPRNGDSESEWATAISGWPFPCLRSVRLSGRVHMSIATNSGPTWPGGYLPVDPYWPGLLADSALIGAALFGLSFLAGVARSALRPRRGLCPQCGYDLRATPARCPECGYTPRAIPAPSVPPEVISRDL